MVEMRHISLLGRCITMMGGDPQFIRPAQKQYWHAGLVNYATDPCCMLLGDMRAELDTADAYRSAARLCCNAIHPTKKGYLEWWGPYIEAQLYEMLAD